MLKKVIVAGVALGALALAFPLSNLVMSRQPRENSPILQYIDPQFKDVAHTFETKCLDCHSTQTKYPWYFSLPLANGIIRHDIQKALGYLDMDKAFSQKEIAPSTLSMLEWVVRQQSMPPLRYKALHWDSGLSNRERERILAWISHEHTKRAPSEVPEALRGEPIQPLPSVIAVNPIKAGLGEKLFHDTRLSKDNTVSCASCHDLKKGGTDQARVSTGVGGAKGDINAPTVFNAAYNIRQFWDGRAADLADQAGGPVTNPIEMAAQWPDVIAKLKQDAEYVKLFNRLYPDGITQANIQDAIATFEETLITPNSRFDQFLLGNADALTSEEKKGYDLFKSVGCATCHMGPAAGGTHFEKFGKVQNYFADRGNIKKPDYGRFNATGREHDRHMFKIPTLRNISSTYPYFHDGSTSDLSEAVRIMAKYQLGKTLSDEETTLIVKFLHTLNGEYRGQKI